MADRAREDSPLHLPGGSEEGAQLPRVVGISWPFPGAKRPLEEGAKLGLWEFVPIGEGRVAIPPADIYILGAWHPVYDQALAVLRGKVGVCWTSSVGEMDMEPVERGYLAGILADPRISFVWFGDESLAQVYPEKGFSAPYPLVVQEGDPPDPEKRDIITFFCPTGHKKNILNQLLAVKLVQRTRKLTLHTNIQGYDKELAAMDCVRHRWLPRPEYEALIASARVNLACSWAETFNFQVAEALMAGTVSVISETVPQPGHTISDPNSPSAIAEGILWAADYPRLLDRYKQLQKVAACRNKLLATRFGELRW